VIHLLQVLDFPAQVLRVGAATRLINALHSHFLGSIRFQVSFPDYSEFAVIDDFADAVSSVDVGFVGREWLGSGLSDGNGLNGGLAFALRAAHFALLEWLGMGRYVNG